MPTTDSANAPGPEGTPSRLCLEERAFYSTSIAAVRRAVAPPCAAVTVTS